MTTKFAWVKIVYLLFFVLTITACAGSSQGSAATAVEAYFKALVGKDTNGLVNSSCAAWEENARQEIRTFDAVKVSLNDLSCRDSGKDGNQALVSCSGKITANYGNEVLEINLADRVYQAVNEDGEWRMCGYHQ